MEFLVALQTDLPPDMPSASREALVDLEFARGLELRRAGVIKEIWRIPGKLSNVGIWACDDPDSLHVALCSLPAWPWMTVTVTPLATHPLMEAQSSRASKTTKET